MKVNTPLKMTPEEAEALLKKWIGSPVVGLRLLIGEGDIALRGTAFSYFAKQLAQHSAMQIFALPVLDNEIEVRLNVCPLDSYGLDLD